MLDFNDLIEAIMECSVGKLDWLTDKLVGKTPVNMIYRPKPIGLKGVYKKRNIDISRPTGRKKTIIFTGGYCSFSLKPVYLM